MKYPMKLSQFGKLLKLDFKEMCNKIMGYPITPFIKSYMITNGHHFYVFCIERVKYRLKLIFTDLERSAK